MRPARHQKRLFVGVVENLKAKSVNEHAVLGVDEFEPVDHAVALEPGGILSQKPRRRALQFVIKAEVNFDQQTVGKFPLDHLATDKRVQANLVLHTLTPAWR